MSYFHVLKTSVYVFYEHLASFKHQCLRKLDFPDGSMVKNPPANAGDAVSIPGSGRSLGEGNGNPLHILAWEIPWTEEPARLYSMELQKSQTPLCD